MDRIPQDELRPSERRVLELAAAGLTNDEIAARLCLSPNSVGTYFKRVYERWHIRGQREEAIRRFRREGRRYAAAE